MILSLDLMILGIVTLVYVLSITIYAIILIARYRKLKNKTLIYTGFSILGLATAWAGVAMNFICIVFFDVMPSMELYFLVHGAYLPISNFFWVITVLSLSNKKSYVRKRIAIVSGIFYMLLEIIYVTIIFTDTTILGTPINEIQVDYAPFSELFLLYCLIMMTILGFWMAKQALKSSEKKIQLKGKLLLGSFILFAFSAVLEIMIPIIPIIVLARILVIICAFLFYGGLVLPKWMEKLFLRKNES